MGPRLGAPSGARGHLRGSGSMREAMWAQDGRREAQVEPRWTQVGAMLGLGGPNMIKMGPKLVQDEPKRDLESLKCRLYWFLHGF